MALNYTIQFVFGENIINKLCGNHLIRTINEKKNYLQNWKLFDISFLLLGNLDGSRWQSNLLAVCISLLN